MTAGWVTVVPGKGQTPEVARLLLALADTPQDVRSGGNGSEFLVPQYLADRYNGQATTAAAPVPTARRRRAKKTEEDA